MDTRAIEVIIPNYNGTSLIKRNLGAVLASLFEEKNVKVTIVDDGSDKKQIEELEELLSEFKKKSDIEITLVKKSKNEGFSSTVNKGAFASSADFLVLLNTDVSPQKNFLKIALSHFDQNPKLFGVGCLDKSIEGSKTILRGRGIGDWKRGFVVHKKGEITRSDTFWIGGGSSIIKKNLFVQLGGFDEIYNPFYWEDIDLSYRAKKSGYEIIFEKESVVVHRHAEGAIQTHYSPFRIKTISFRNQFIFVWKNIDDVTLLVNHLVWLPYYFLVALLHMDLAFYAGFILAISRFTDIIKKRKKQKEQYKKTDRQLLKPENA
ncbi:MAG: hypothetical protein COX79_04840 [Candidatus Levybacteria bacterium CG_4_10_14_0_2_um_filter_36_16]|nr:MAG: hypothetical protein AUK12_00525 [Candidatus Levybacteria bacterium CG2_30_37_29]PIR79259.1 MAG: hypothetical protein COU26_02050 [Candidatus Levybacteria bacterium CG10_big_fil_rev_8_21_14_0_10_36_30]PIZ96569.1 MAG: hypothetical protein COX79_04840 [Candidatus Levybacteria bacterium CG_4_10_14_0_2_um_filter_36_16]PJA90332.1 MAG: hypothetical protein CO136_02385 [Candidatus Levybacteria bacterium CG_4_9_14_3_um_filter_36_7]